MPENNNTYEQMGQFTKIPFDFIENAKDLSLHARWLFIALLYHRNGKSGLAFPSYTRINELTGLRREMISKSIRELESKGWIRKRRRYSNSNIYTLAFATKGREPGNEGEQAVEQPPGLAI